MLLFLNDDISDIPCEGELSQLCLDHLVGKAKYQGTNIAIKSLSRLIKRMLSDRMNGGKFEKTCNLGSLKSMRRFARY